MSTISLTAGGRSAQEVLAWSRQIIEGVMRDAVVGLPESVRAPVGYHLGWWDPDGRATEFAGGKALRPTLLLLCAEAMGGTAADATPAAAAVELAHNFSVIHDDVMDGDLVRRHRPTVWSVYGVDVAVLAGDALIALAFQTLALNPCPSPAQATARLGRCVVELCDGQAGDLAFEARREVTVQQSLQMVAAKTASLLECSCALGALYAGADSERIAALGSFGRELGIAFQLVDDLLGIWGDPDVTGKPVGSDLARRKKTLPVVAALASDTAAARELADFYRGDEPLSPDELARAAALVEQAGGRAWAQQQATQRMVAAIAHLDAANCQPRSRAELVSLARLVAERDR